MTCKCEQNSNGSITPCGAHSYLYRDGRTAGLRQARRLLDDLKVFCESARKMVDHPSARGAYAEIQLECIRLSADLPLPKEEA